MRCEMSALSAHIGVNHRKLVFTNEYTRDRYHVKASILMVFPWPGREDISTKDEFSSRNLKLKDLEVVDDDVACLFRSLSSYSMSTRATSI